MVSDDTDVFALLVYFYLMKGVRRPMVMESAVHGREAIDIATTVKKTEDVTPNILQLHALSGCDMVAKTYNIGKPTAIARSMGSPYKFLYLSCK